VGILGRVKRPKIEQKYLRGLPRLDCDRKNGGGGSTVLLTVSSTYAASREDSPSLEPTCEVIEALEEAEQLGVAPTN